MPHYIVWWKIPHGSCITTPDGTTCVQDLTPVVEPTPAPTAVAVEKTVEPTVVYTGYCNPPNPKCGCINGVFHA